MGTEPTSPTLLRRLLLALLPALVTLGAIGGALDYLQVRRLADDAYDQALASTAIGLAARLETDRDDDVTVHLAALAEAVSRRNPDGGFHFVVLDASGNVISGRADLAPLAAPSGTANPKFRDGAIEGQPMRIATYRYDGPDGRALIIVAESLNARAAAVAQALRPTLWINLLMVAAVLGVVMIGVRAALRPLHALGQRASQQDTGALQALPVEGVLQEVRPLVNGINRLIDKLRASTQAQQAFLSASAHQLRTPLAGLQAQLDVMMDEELPTTLWHARLSGLLGSVQRLTRLTQQMLALARTDASVQGGLPNVLTSPVDLVALLHALAEQHLNEALTRQVELTLEADAAQVNGERWMLLELAANLIDNALRYAPSHSQVTLRCGIGDAAAGEVGRAFLEIEDEGPGIAAHQRERVFDRFVRLSDADGRSAGSGLGLSIVREVAQVHGASVCILDGRSGRGTCMRVEFLALNSSIRPT